jgi:hypothetical protein
LSEKKSWKIAAKKKQEQKKNGEEETALCLELRFYHLLSQLIMLYFFFLSLSLSLSLSLFFSSSSLLLAILFAIFLSNKMKRSELSNRLAVSTAFVYAKLIVTS